MSDELPIALSDTSKVDFQRLLEVLCPLSFKPKPITSVEIWHSVLKLSTKWRLLDIRSHAIETMNQLNLSHSEMLRYGRDYKVSNWMVKGYLGFVMQGAQLSECDAKDIMHGLSLDEGVRQLMQVVALHETNKLPDPRGWRCLNCEYAEMQCIDCVPTRTRRKGLHSWRPPANVKAVVDEGMVRRTFKVEVAEIVAYEQSFNRE
ncbi:BTB domain-containing protein [Pleurotus pulmonarius]|nr:hypothetical protein EYR38_007190 [Pleurotus pulmonarius]